MRQRERRPSPRASQKPDRENFNPGPIIHWYVQGFRPLAAMIILALFSAPLCTADPLSISASPGVSYIGDRIELSGTTEARNIIAVYLFVTGPGLDSRGVCLENLNLPAGLGYFSQARVNPDGSFRYEWNTAYLAGRLEPGTYTVYVVNAPLNLHRLGMSARAVTNVTFADRESPGLGADAVPLTGAGFALAAFLITARKRE
jgi:hypothetical protein